MSTTLDDFRKVAATGNGVGVIPFQDIRREATSLADEVKRSKAASKWKYDMHEKQKLNLLKDKANKQKEIEAKKKEIEDFKRKHDEVDVSPLEDDQEKLEDELEKIDDAIEKKNDELEDGAETWRRLWNARGGLRETFKDALGKIKEAKSSPDKYLDDDATEDDKELLEKSLYVIEGMIEEEEEEHEKQEKGAQDTEEKFKKLIQKTRL